MSSVSGKRPGVPPCRTQAASAGPLRARAECAGAGPICAPGKCLKTRRPFDAFSSFSPHFTSHCVMKCCGPTNSATLTSNFSCAAALAASDAAMSPATTRLMRPPRFLARRLYVAVRVLRLPAPGIAAHGVDLELGAPLEKLLRARGVGVAGGNIAGATREQLERNRAAACPLERLHRFQHGVAAPGAEVHDERA